MKYFLFLALFISADAMALDFKCKASGIHYLNEFEMTGSTEDSTLTATVRKAGYDSETETIELQNLDVITERVVNTDIYVDPFYFVRFKSKEDADQKVFINIVLGYPGKFTSFLRLEGLRQYKATCKEVL